MSDTVMSATASSPYEGVGNASVNSSLQDGSAMGDSSRRAFLKAAGGGVLVAAAWAAGAQEGVSLKGGPEVGRRHRGIPPHEGRTITGVHGYANRESVFAGDSISFHISATEPYALQIYRLGADPDNPVLDVMRHAFPSNGARPQPIHPGSYVFVSRSVGGTSDSGARVGVGTGVVEVGFTIEAWVRPWQLTRLMGVVGQNDKDSDSGFSLGIGEEGSIGYFLGNGRGPDSETVHRTDVGVVKKGVWHHVVASWDGGVKRVYVDGVEVASWEFSGPVVWGSHPVRLGAMGQGGEATRFLDGDLARVVLYGRCLTSVEIGERHDQRALVAPEGEAILADWTFEEERGNRVGDRSGQGRHGVVINHGTWMIGGPSFEPEVTRFGEYEPDTDATRGHGLRLASDDLYDCRWEATHVWAVPPEEQPGLYVGRIRWVEGERTRLTHITFVVKRGRHRPPADLLVICSTNTWHAYNGAPFGVWPDTIHAVIGTGGLPNALGDPPAFCLYRAHAGGQGTYQMGRHMPCPAASPYALYGGPTRYSHLMRAERFLHKWLEEAGYDFDLVTDLDVHQAPDIFERHPCVILNGHSEYWSVPALEGLERSLAGGGNLIVLSGNSLFWRVSFDEEGVVMECRKVDAPGDQLPATRRGECWHSQDGERGGLLRECGHPGWGVCGLETLGWNDQSNPKNFGPYEVVAADHFLFNSPEKTGLGNGDYFGHGMGGGLPLANGHEIDVRLSTLSRMQEAPDPEGGRVPSDPAGIVLLANGIIPWKEGGVAFDYYFRPIRPKTDQGGGEMIYWERPEGGRVFNAGSIGSGWALAADLKFQSLMRNVLHHFGVSRD